MCGQARIDTGRQLAATHAELLEAIETAYGVDRHILVAIWGVESAYGTEMGSRNVVRSLATLAMADARRAPFWTRELIAALRMLQDGAVQPEKFVGSWAGAMGHTQFIPSTYNARAVDFDKDGRRDIWETVADALASSANYLRASGWVAGRPWGFEVTLPPGFDFAWSAPRRTRTLAEWQAAGVKAVAARGDPASELPLELILPAGARGPAFLVTGNFRVLLKYNQSTSYALAVGHLADRIAGGAALAQPGRQTTSRSTGPSARSCKACWRHGGSTPAASTASSATARAPPSAPRSAPSSWPRTAIRAWSCCSGCAATARLERPCC